MYVHPKLVAFEDRLKTLFDEVDRRLEDRWGHRYTVHPNRPRRGETGNPEADGLFEAAADFSPGFGSERGRGYLVRLRVATLERVSAGDREAFLEEAASCVRELLPSVFPERKLELVRDGAQFKIVGDFSLGDI